MPFVFDGAEEGWKGPPRAYVFVVTHAATTVVNDRLKRLLPCCALQVTGVWQDRCQDGAAMTNIFEIKGAGMDTAKAIEIVSALAKGINPLTGDEFSERSPYRNPRTIRALLMAVKGLEQIKNCDDRRQQLPSNAGQPWRDEEDQQLISAFDAGRTISQLAKKHQRTEGAIRSRLFVHGRLQLPLVVRGARSKKFQL